MKKLIVCIFSITFLGFVGMTQNTDQKVQDFLGNERYAELEAQNSKLIDYLKVRIEEGYQVSPSISEKKDSYEEINKVYFKKSEISIEDFIEALNQESFNILNYSFPGQTSEKTTHYLLGDSGILLTIYSNAVINNKVRSAQ